LKPARPIVDDVCYRAIELWLDRLTSRGEFDDRGITAGRLRSRILQRDGVAVPRAVILAVAASKGFDIGAGEYDVWIALLADEVCPV